MAARRVNWWVRWRKKDARWAYYRGRTLQDFGFEHQERAAAHAATNARIEWETKGQPGELLILSKKGTIRERRTYGDDPRRSKG